MKKHLRPLVPLALALAALSLIPAPSPARADGPTLRVVAASPQNVLRGAARVFACRACAAGTLVRWIGHGGSLNLVIMAPTAGTYRVYVDYSSVHGDRVAYVRTDFDVPLSYTFPATKAWNALGQRSFDADLTAGVNHIAFANAGGWCPDISALTFTFLG